MRTASLRTNTLLRDESEPDRRERHGNIVIKRDALQSRWETHIIDFGLGVELPPGEDFLMDTWMGTLMYCPNEHMGAFGYGRSCTYSARTDLESLVKSWIVLSLSSDFRYKLLQLAEDEKVPEIERLWLDVLDFCPSFKSAYAAAAKADYGEVKKTILESPFLQQSES